MRNLLIWSCIFGSVLMVDMTLYLPGQDLPQESTGHITAELACQAPPHHAGPNKVIGTPNPVYKDHFGADEEIWAAVNPKTCCHDREYKKARLYVVDHKSPDQWQDNTRLKDVTTRGYKMVTIQPGTAKNNYTRVWEEGKPRVRDEGYDVVVDFPPFGYYNKGRDILDCGGCGDAAGFYVPEEWVCLEEIYFNFDDKSDCCDAINIRKNWEEEVGAPEWKKGEISYPVAYIKNRFIIVKAVFSAAAGVKKANIKACKINGDLGCLIEKPVKFEENKTTKVNFHVYGCTPDGIKEFCQEWEWYCEVLNGKQTPGMHIATSKNKIYIVLSQPNCPWKTTGKAKPWADILDWLCPRVKNVKTPEGAAEKITHILYNDFDARYDMGKNHHYTKDSTTGDFYLKDFWEKHRCVGLVNCHDMGKALVTFSNIVGCNLSYRRSEPFGNVNCIKLVGKDPDCNQYFENHTFGSIGDRIFDACFIMCPCCSPGISPHNNFWLTNILWEDYKDIVVKNGGAAYPQGFSFAIGVGN